MAIHRRSPKSGSWLDSITTIATNGSAHTQVGGAIHRYRFSRSETAAPIFVNADGEMVIIPQAGRLRVTTEMDIIEVEPAEFAVIPPGIKFSVETVDEVASRWINENYGEFLRFPTQA